MDTECSVTGGTGEQFQGYRNPFDVAPFTPARSPYNMDPWLVRQNQTIKGMMRGAEDERGQLRGRVRQLEEVMARMTVTGAEGEDTSIFPFEPS